MGGEPWFHVAPYQSDIPAALEALRQRVFAEGEYRGSEAEPRRVEHQQPVTHLVIEGEDKAVGGPRVGADLGHRRRRRD